MANKCEASVIVLKEILADLLHESKKRSLRIDIRSLTNPSVHSDIPVKWMALRSRPCFHIAFNLVQCPWGPNIVLDPTAEQYGLPAEARRSKLRQYNKRSLIRKVDCASEPFAINEGATFAHASRVDASIDALANEGQNFWKEAKEKLATILHDCKLRSLSGQKLWELDSVAFASARTLLLDRVLRETEDLQDEQILARRKRQSKTA
jgi:hypothetical protein